MGKFTFSLVREQSAPFSGIFLPFSGKPLKLASQTRIDVATKIQVIGGEL